MERIFENKVAIITRGSFGIGRAAAIAFVKRGAKIVADWIEDKEHETSKQIEALGGEYLFVKCDVSKDIEVKDIVDKTIIKFGRLDYAFNNAGVEGASAITHECTK